jgi:hypothetical protein
MVAVAVGGVEAACHSEIVVAWTSSSKLWPSSLFVLCVPFLGEALNLGAFSDARLFLGSKAKVAPGFLSMMRRQRIVRDKNGNMKTGRVA